MKSGDNRRIDPRNYSALTRFFRGYLHQDLAVEHGSPIGAARAFRRDADERETMVVRSELERLLTETSSLDFPELSRVLETLGSAWRFATREELEHLRDAFK